MVATDDTAGDVGDKQQYSPMFHVSSGSSKPFLFEMAVNEMPLMIEVVTGASLSIASEKTFNQI